MRIGFVSLPLTGHLNRTTSLARKLQSRGDEVRFIGVPDVEPAVRAAELTFEPYCEEEYPEGSIARIYAPIAKLHGLDPNLIKEEEPQCLHRAVGLEPFTPCQLPAPFAPFWCN